MTRTPLDITCSHQNALGVLYISVRRTAGEYADIWETSIFSFRLKSCDPRDSLAGSVFSCGIGLTQGRDKLHFVLGASCLMG